MRVVKTELQIGLAWNEREEFIPLQTSEYIQQTTKLIYKVLEPSAGSRPSMTGYQKTTLTKGLMMRCS